MKNILKKIIGIYLFLLMSFQVLYAIDIELAGEPTILSGNPQGKVRYRFPTKNTYNGKHIDLMVEIIGKDSGYDSRKSGLISWSIKNNSINFWPVESGCQYPNIPSEEGWLDIQVLIVKAGTYEPIKIDNIVMTGYDIDVWRGGLWDSVYAVDYFYTQGANAVVLDSNSKLRVSNTELTGTNGIRYNIKVDPYSRDCTDSPSDPRCNISFVYNNSSSINFRVSTTGDFYSRLIGVTFSSKVLDKYTSNKDYGDAPSSYGSASHKINQSIYLGNGLFPDTDSNNSYSKYADEDDGVFVNNRDLQMQTLLRDKNYKITIHKHGTGYLYGWIDWNKNGIFEDSEKIIDTLKDDKNITSINLQVPKNAKSGLIYARFRYSKYNVPRKNNQNKFKFYS